MKENYQAVFIFLIKMGVPIKMRLIEYRIRVCQDIKCNNFFRLSIQKNCNIKVNQVSITTIEQFSACHDITMH